jgi:hypothetical protein
VSSDPTLWREVTPGESKYEGMRISEGQSPEVNPAVRWKGTRGKRSAISEKSHSGRKEECVEQELPKAREFGVHLSRPSAEDRC